MILDERRVRRSKIIFVWKQLLRAIFKTPAQEQELVDSNRALAWGKSGDLGILLKGMSFFVVWLLAFKSRK